MINDDDATSTVFKEIKYYSKLLALCMLLITTQKTHRDLLYGANLGFCNCLYKYSLHATFACANHSQT